MTEGTPPQVGESQSQIWQKDLGLACLGMGLLNVAERLFDFTISGSAVEKPFLAAATIASGIGYLSLRVKHQNNEST